MPGRGSSGAKMLEREGRQSQTLQSLTSTSEGLKGNHSGSNKCVPRSKVQKNDHTTYRVIKVPTEMPQSPPKRFRNCECYRRRGFEEYRA